MPKNIFVKLLQRSPILHSASAEQIVNMIVKAMSLPKNPQVKLSRKQGLLCSLPSVSGSILHEQLSEIKCDSGSILLTLRHFCYYFFNMVFDRTAVKRHNKQRMIQDVFGWSKSKEKQNGDMKSESMRP